MSEKSLRRRLEEMEINLRPHFKPGFLQRDNTLFQFLFAEDPPYFLSVTSLDFHFSEGSHCAPTITLYLDNHSTCFALLTGKLDGMSEFMAGRYRADGNIVLSQLLLYLFKDQDETNIYEVQD